MILTRAHASTTESRTAVAESAAGSRHRVVALDALRGFALCGILLVNIPWQIVTIRMQQGPASGGRYFAVELLEYLVHGRFFPIFSVLFGISFALFLDTAAARARHPRLVLLRRLVVLGVLGVAHQQLHNGEALTPYAIVGVVVLLPASWLPRWIVLPAAVVALAGGVLGGGGLLLIPGLFLLGLAAVRFGIIDTLPRRRKQIAVLFCVAAAAAIPATVWQAATWTDPNEENAAAVAGLIGALAYSTGLLLILGTRTGAVLERILAPLGRMALTNYLTATLIAAAAGPLLGLEHSAHYGRMIVLALVILAAQAAFSRYWLARYQYGPVEWIWRCLTWWTRTSNRRVTQPSGVDHNTQQPAAHSTIIRHDRTQAGRSSPSVTSASRYDRTLVVGVDQSDVKFQCVGRAWSHTAQEPDGHGCPTGTVWPRPS